MADVLEHMPFPRPGLAAAHQLLRPDGVLFLSMQGMKASYIRSTIAYWK
jgi:protein O-GlcNAc transferase